VGVHSKEVAAVHVSEPLLSLHRGIGVIERCSRCSAPAFRQSCGEPFDFALSKRNWLVVSTSLKNMKVSWDYDIPNLWKNNPNVPNHQPGKIGSEFLKTSQNPFSAADVAPAIIDRGGHK